MNNYEVPPVPITANSIMVPQNVFQVSITDEHPNNAGTGREGEGQSVPNPMLKMLRKTNYVLNIILAVSALIMTLTYIVLWVTLISPPLDLTEVGNWFVFVLFFSSTGFVFLIATVTIVQHRNGANLRFGYGFKCIILLAICIGALCTLWMGAAESTKGKYDKNVKTTYFGAYIAKVCADENINTNANAAKIEDEQKILDDNWSKCEATKRLKIVIYSMYSWVGILIIVVALDMVFGLSNYGHKDDPEFVLPPAV